jgi:hypothetical protein
MQPCYRLANNCKERRCRQARQQLPAQAKEDREHRRLDPTS